VRSQTLQHEVSIINMCKKKVKELLHMRPWPKKKSNIYIYIYIYIGKNGCCVFFTLDGTTPLPP